MQAALGVVIYIVVGVAGALALVALARIGRTYEEIGRGGLADAPGPDQREEEIRQLLRARETRRAARAAPAPVADADPELAAEIRAHVERRNARALARGAPAVDVEEEVARRLREAADG